MIVAGRGLPRLIVITDWGIEDLLPRLAAALSLGPQVGVQHRHPQIGGRQFLSEARRVTEIAADQGNPVFVNERLDVALLTGAHLHLPSRSLAVAEARAHLPADRWVSMAVHDRSEAALSAGASLALVSPVFAPGSKRLVDRAPLGTAGFHELARELACPAYALGGISGGGLEQLGRAMGAAVISAVLRADDPRQATAELLSALGKAERVDDQRRPLP